MKLDPRLPAPFRTALRDSLSTVKVARVVTSKPDLLIMPAPSGRGVRVVAAADNVPQTEVIDPASAGAVGRIRAAVRAYARNRQLRRLELTDSRVNVTMELIPTRRRIVSGECQGDDTIPVLAKRSAGNQWELNPGDVYLLRLRNEGRDPAYVAILSLGPDGTVQQLFPPPGELGSDNFLAPGRSYLLHDICYYAEEVLGEEVLKLFATRDHVDFAPVLVERSQRTRSPSNPLEQLIGDAYSGTRTGTVMMARGTGSTYGITINIVKPKSH